MASLKSSRDSKRLWAEEEAEEDEWEDEEDEEENEEDDEDDEDAEAGVISWWV